MTTPFLPSFGYEPHPKEDGAIYDPSLVSNGERSVRVASGQGTGSVRAKHSRSAADSEVAPGAVKATWQATHRASAKGRRRAVRRSLAHVVCTFRASQHSPRGGNRQIGLPDRQLKLPHLTRGGREIKHCTVQKPVHQAGWSTPFGDDGIVDNTAAEPARVLKYCKKERDAMKCRNAPPLCSG